MSHHLEFAQFSEPRIFLDVRTYDPTLEITMEMMTSHVYRDPGHDMRIHEDLDMQGLGKYSCYEYCSPAPAPF